MITPQETQRMMFGDQAFRNTRRITEERDMTKEDKPWNYSIGDDGFDPAQQNMIPGQEMFLGTNTSNPFSDQFSNLYNIL